MSQSLEDVRAEDAITMPSRRAVLIAIVGAGVAGRTMNFAARAAAGGDGADGESNQAGTGGDGGTAGGSDGGDGATGGTGGQATSDGRGDGRRKKRRHGKRKP